MAVHIIDNYFLEVNACDAGLDICVSDPEWFEHVDISEARLASLLSELGIAFSRIERLAWCEMGNEYSEMGYAFVAHI